MIQNRSVIQLGIEEKNMAERIIDLDYSTYQNLVKMVQSSQENIYFRYGNDMVSIPNKVKNKNKLSSEQNIVQRWMNDIIVLSEEGNKGTGDVFAKKYFNSIKSYCKAVIVSVTS